MATADVQTVAPLTPAPASPGNRAELSMNKWQRKIGFIAGPLVLATLWVAPLPLPLEAHRLAAIMALVITWWITEAVPLAVTSLIGVGLTVLTGIATPREAFAPFATPIIFLFIGAFILAKAASLHELDLRLASALLRSRVVGGSVSRVPMALGLLCVAVSGWFSGTAAVAMMTPIALGVLAAMRAEGRDLGTKFPARLMLSTAFGASVGSKLTPIGAPSNLVALGFIEGTVGQRVPFFTWMVVGAPLVICMTIAMIAVLGWMMPLGQENQDAKLSNAHLKSFNTGPLTVGQRNCLIVLALAATGWLLPGFFDLFSPGSAISKLLSERLDLGTVAILAASLLFIMPADTPERRFTMDWKEANKIDWGTILLFGGGLSLGALMFSTGLANTVGRGLIVLSGANTLWTVTAMAVVASTVLTSFTSNVATAAMMTPIVLAIAVAAGINPTPPGLGVAFGCGIAYLLPISCGANAIVYGTGVIPIKLMVKVGAVMSVIGMILTFLALRLLLPLTGLA
jgi:solute carrier family 13 (sodium-dependent dicarboxylate transporter), member 2/3/5